jgi:glutaminase
VADPLPVVERYISTGHLPEPERVAALVRDAHSLYAETGDGAVSQVYPALAAARPDLFGICVVGVSGRAYTAGDAEDEFTIMSVSKPFVFALVCAELGADEARRRLGVNATGLPFNSPEAIERSHDGRTNPMVNAGAIATTSLVPGGDPASRWERIRERLSAFAGRDLRLDDDVYRCASESNHVNRGLVELLQKRGRVAGDPDTALDLYTRQCALLVTAKDLAAMGATLADGGMNPVTGVRVVDASACRHTLAVMTTAGLYETSGDWLYDVGLPGKSGIGGGIVTVAPGKGGLGTFSPPLDGAGNSVRGQLATRMISRGLGLDLLASEPEPLIAARPGGARDP